MSAWRERIRIGDLSPDMNVTPLVDVVLVLLIIFMVVAPRLDQDVPVNLPGIFNPEEEMVITVRLSELLGAGTTSMATVTTPAGGRSTVFFTG